MLLTENLQIERLQTIFQTGYGFHCRIAALKDDRDPQTELDYQIISHVRDHDDEDSLLIVYYTGHGNQVVEEDNQRRLELTAYVIPCNPRSYADCWQYANFEGESGLSPTFGILG
jgi:hypothetical protein